MPKRGEESWKVLWRRRQTSQSEVVELTVSGASTGVLRNDIQGPGEEISSLDCQKLPTDGNPDKCGLEEIPSCTELNPVSGGNTAVYRPGKADLYSELSITLTCISILAAFAISIIEFMGIAVEKCQSCSDAAESSDGLDGKWWRFWQACNDSSGYIGAGIVGTMLLCGISYLGLRRHRRKKALALEARAPGPLPVASSGPAAGDNLDSANV